MPHNPIFLLTHVLFIFPFIITFSCYICCRMLGTIVIDGRIDMRWIKQIFILKWLVSYIFILIYIYIILYIFLYNLYIYIYNFLFYIIIHVTINIDHHCLLNITSNVLHFSCQIYLPIII